MPAKTPRPGPARLLRGVPVLLVGLVALTGCAGSGSPGAAATLSAGPLVTDAPVVAPSPTAAACTGLSAPTTLRWPDGVPPNVPVPATAVLDKVVDQPDGLKLVLFGTTRPLRDGLLEVVRALPAAGYTLGRGDAEPLEADVPFSNGVVRGTMRMLAKSECTTGWLLAIAVDKPDGSGPRLPVYTPRNSPSPLPFG